jgi:hypothetical protein
MSSLSKISFRCGQESIFSFSKFSRRISVFLTKAHSVKRKSIWISLRINSVRCGIINPDLY